MINTTLCPCKECKDRYRACWGKCEKYIEWRKAFDEWKALTDAERAKYISMEQYIGERKFQMYKKYGGK